MADDISILQEIDDSLKVENMERFLRRYGKLVIAGVVMVILTTVASVVMKNQRHNANIKDTAVLLKAAEWEAGGNYQGALAELGKISNEKNDATALSAFREAQSYIKLGKFKEAQAVYDKVAEGKKNDEALRSLAQINSSIVGLNHGGGQEDIDKLKPLLEKNAPSAAIAGEVTALWLIQQGKLKEAREALENITKNPSMTSQQKRRATELLDGFEAISRQEEKK